MKSKVWCVGWWSQCYGGRDGPILGAHWPPSLVGQAPGWWETLSQNESEQKPKEQYLRCPLVSTCMCTQVHAHLHTCTHREKVNKHSSSSRFPEADDTLLIHPPRPIVIARKHFGKNGVLPFWPWELTSSSWCGVQSFPDYDQCLLPKPSHPASCPHPFLAPAGQTRGTSSCPSTQSTKMCSDQLPAL